MPPASQVYKGIAPHAGTLAAWLTASP
jgi:hypothetical protein